MSEYNNAKTHFLFFARILKNAIINNYFIE